MSKEQALVFGGRRAAHTLLALVLLCGAAVLPGLSPQNQAKPALEPASMHGVSGTQVRGTGGVLVPKRVRMILGFVQTVMA